MFCLLCCSCCLTSSVLPFHPDDPFHCGSCSCSGGSGLGLFIAKGVVKLHEGATCGARSEGLGHGSTFYVTIPITNETPPRPVSSVEAGVSSKSHALDASDEPTYPALNILCVVRVTMFFPPPPGRLNAHVPRQLTTFLPSIHPSSFYPSFSSS